MFTFILHWCENIGAKYVPSRKAGDPLIITPLLKSGEIELARNKSLVPPLLPNIFSHSGFLTVNETFNSNLFFWFFKQSSPEWKSKPVILWLQGGPGCSSIFGLFVENGPFTIKNGNLKEAKFPWTRNYNVLYIDNPIGSGYSFSNDYYVTTEEEIGKHLYESLIQFFQLFPEVKDNKFFITGESYAGKYIPTLAYEIHKQNPSASVPINLKGLFIGNGYTDPENMQDYAKHLHRLGLLDHKERMILENNEELGKAFIRSSLWKSAEKTVDKEILDFIQNKTGFLYLYDYVREKFDGGDSYVEFIESDAFRKAIHVGKLKYNDCSRKVHKNLEDDMEKSLKPVVEKLVEVYPIMFFSGQLDIIVAHYLTTSFINELHWSGAEEFLTNAHRKKWYVNGHLAGFYKTYGNLKEVLIRGASHMVAAQQPLFLLDLLNKFVNNEI